MQAMGTQSVRLLPSTRKHIPQQLWIVICN